MYTLFLCFCFLILTFSPEEKWVFLNNIWNFINFIGTDDPCSTVGVCACVCLFVQEKTPILTVKILVILK